MTQQVIEGEKNKYMNNGYQKYNGCGADKEGGKFFKTFFFTKLQSKHVRPLAYNVQIGRVHV